MNVPSAASASKVLYPRFGQNPASLRQPGGRLPVFADTLPQPRTSALEMLELLPQALLVLQDDRSVLASNQRANRMMADRCIQMAEGKLAVLGQLGALQVDQVLHGARMTGSYDCGVWFSSNLSTGWLHAAPMNAWDWPGTAAGAERAVLLVVQLDQPALTQAARIDAITRQAGLSPTERHVLMLLADGLTVEAAAQHLDLRLSTLRSHVRNLLGKTRAPTLMQLLRWTGSAQPLPTTG